MFERLFSPRSVAIIGASTKELSIGNVILKNLLHYEFKGPIYPINPKADEVRGVKAYPSMADLPGDVDLVHISIPAKFVPAAIEDCGKKGVKFIIINSAGFKEVGPEGAALEKEIVLKAHENGIRLFGPNCQGIINSDPEVKAYCDFTFTYPDPGNISVVAQSGGVGAVIMQRFFDLGVGMRFYASNGNACDISIEEILDYWAGDEKTRVIVLYVESLSDPKRFLDIAKKVAARKPVLAMRGGRTTEGAKAATSHTGGLAGSGLATDLIFKKAGFVTFTDEEEMCQAAIAFADQPIPRGKRVGIVTDTGGPAIIATDELVSQGLEMPMISDRAKDFLKDKLYAEAAISNPIDVLATAAAPHWRAAMDALLDENHIDSIYLTYVTPPFVDNVSVAKEIVEIGNMKKKPVICNYMTDKTQFIEPTKILKDGGIPCYTFPEAAAKALAAMVRYNDIKTRKTGEIKTFSDINADTARENIQNAKNAGREILTAQEVYNILGAYGIPIAGWEIAANTDDAVKTAEKLGYPVVIKADSVSIIHKSDVGGVAVNLENESSVRSTMENMQKKFHADDLKFLVQKFIPGGTELIIGANADPGIGHLIMFGLGGVFVEIFKDVVFSLAPVTDTDATEMLASIKASSILKGARGKEGVDESCIIETLQRISQLVTDVPEIQEMDLNPVLGFKDKIVVVDARIKI